jgi:hypothetical protein
MPHASLDSTLDLLDSLVAFDTCCNANLYRTGAQTRWVC